MMKRLLILLALMAGTLSLSAKSLVLLMTDGTKIYYLLGGEVNPKMTMNDGEVTVNTDKYVFSNIERFYISDTDDPLLAIDDARAEGSWKDGVFYVKTASAVQVYTVDGRLVDASVAPQGALKAVDTSRLPAGTYVLRVGDKSMKFMKR